MPFRAGRPIMLCLVGDSGAGKSTLSRGCVEILGKDRVVDICMDDYHSLDRTGRSQRGITALHPDCNHLDLLAQHIRLLKQGERIFKPVYDHSDGTFAKPEFVTPGPIMLIHGLHGLYTPELRRHWDVSVYLDPHPTLRVAWKIKRDVGKRGYTRDEVVKQLADRQEDSDAFVVPQREKADIVISFCPPADYDTNPDDSRLNVKITLRHPIPLPDLADALGMGEKPAGRKSKKNGDAAVVMVRGEDGADQLEIRGSISDEATRSIENRMWDHMAGARHLRSDRLGVYQDIDVQRRSNPLAVTQLVLTYYLVKVSALVLKQEQLHAEATAAAGGMR